MAYSSRGDMMTQQETLIGTLANWAYNKFSKASLSQPAPKYIGQDIQVYSSNYINWGMFSEEELIQLLSIISWIYADIQLISRNVWASSFRIKRKGESRKMIEDRDHPFLDVYHNPNPWMTKSYLIDYLMNHLQTSSKGAFAYLAPDQNNVDELLEIWPINSHQILPIKDSTNYVTKFAYFPKKESEKPIIIDGRYILWIRYADPDDYWKSRPPFLSAIRPAQVELGIQESQNKLYNENRGLPLTLVSLDQDLSEPDFEKAKAQIKRDWQEESSTIAVTRAGQISTKSLGFTQSELQSILAQKMNRDQIDTIFFGYPIHSDQLTSGEGLKEMDKIIKEQVYHPLLVLLQDHIQNQIIKRFYAEDGVFAKYDDPRTYDRALNIQENMIYSRHRTMNEMRENDGWGPLDDPEGMEGLGDLPMPLANNASFVSSLYGIGMTNGREPEKPPEVGNLSDFQDPEAITNQMARGDEPAIGNEINVKNLPPVVQEGIKAEMKRYRTVAKRGLEREGNPLFKTFETDVIPRQIFDEITRSLQEVATTEEIEALFEEWV